MVEKQDWLNALFQFTPLREGRRKAGKRATADIRISIHAPPRGATPRHAGRIYPRKFQFTPLREGRHIDFLRSSASTRFQFTPLREGRQERYPFLRIPSRGFQFTPLREGRRRSNA